MRTQTFEEEIGEHSAESRIIDEGIERENTIALLIPIPEEGLGIVGADAVEFMQYLRERETDDLEVKILGDGEDLHYSQMNSIIVDIGTYLVTDVAVPIFVAVLSAFVEDKLRQYKSDDIELRISVIKEKGKGKSKKKYQVSGKAKDVLKIVKELEK